MPDGCNDLVIFMIDINAKIFELFDQKLDLVLLGISTHVTKLFILVASNDFVNSPGDAISNCNFGLISRAQFKFPLVVLSPVKGSAF